MSTDTTSPEFFEGKYRENADPWDFATSDYERARYDAILHALDERKYVRAFEPGCSVGELTARLAGICGRVEAIDFSPSAVAIARERCRKLSNVYVTCESVAEARIQGGFDLIVLSEIGYYFEPKELERISARFLRHLVPTGVMLASHWLGESHDHLLSGDAVHDSLRLVAAQAGLVLVHSERHAEFRLDRWEKP
jgi:SAM-dependent methyltransferase